MRAHQVLALVLVLAGAPAPALAQDTNCRFPSSMCSSARFQIVGSGTPESITLQSGIATFSAGLSVATFLNAEGNNGFRLDNGTVLYGVNGATLNLRSNISAATASASVPALKLFAFNALDANDLVFDVEKSDGTPLFSVDVEGDISTLGRTRSINGFAMGSSGECTLTQGNLTCTSQSANVSLIQSQDNTRTVRVGGSADAAGELAVVLGTRYSDAQGGGGATVRLASFATGVSASGDGVEKSWIRGSDGALCDASGNCITPTTVRTATTYVTLSGYTQSTADNTPFVAIRALSSGQWKSVDTTIEQVGAGAGTFTVTIKNVASGSTCTSAAISCAAAVGTITNTSCTVDYSAGNTVQLQWAASGCATRPRINVVAQGTQ